MKTFSIVILIGLSFLSAKNYFFSKEGIIKSNHVLNDGESLSISSIIDFSGNGELITENSFPSFSSAILRSFETTSNNAMDFVKYANSISKNRNIGYWSVIPYTYYGDVYSQTRISDPTYVNELNYSTFSDYYHAVFQNKAARTILFDNALEIVCGLCNKYPTDFKKSVLEELNLLSIFSNSLSSLKNFDSDNTNDYWKGFIYRRYFTDKVPILEIQNAIIKAQNKIKAIDISKQPDAMYELVINDQVCLFYSSEKMVFYSRLSKKEIIFSYDYDIKNIKYLKDATGEYYQLTGTKNTIPITYLFDKNLIKIE